MRTVYTYLLMLFAVLGAVGSAYALPQTFVQEGLVTNRVGQPMQGAHRVEIQLFNAVAGGNRLYQEVHPNVTFINGYYAISVGSETAFPVDLFESPTLFVAFKVDDGEWLEPRQSIQRVPAAFIANSATVAVNVTGDITPNTVSVNGAVVIDEAGKWVGDPTGSRRARRR